MKIGAPLLRGRELIVVSAVNLVAWIGTGAGVLVLANGSRTRHSRG